MRVFLDTNVLVSAFATRGLCADLFQVVLADHDLVVGETVLTELQGVLRRKMRLPQDTLTELDAFLRRQGEVARAEQRTRVKLRDPADVVVLSEAVAGGADLLVTGDRDLLVIAERAPLPIRSPREFWDLLRSPDPEGRSAS